ncbi:MAG: lysophospholipid acyltransferase family protein [Candidatus Desulfacyla sp.]
MKPVADIVITLAIWIYYIFSYLIFFSLCYFAAFLFAKDREISFQRINHLYYRSFFFFVRTIVPGVRFTIQDDIFSIRASVIVCNHLSYLDPILLISLFERHKTIVKNVFFKVPIFGSVLRAAGYLPATASGTLVSLMMERMNGLKDYLSSGGNFFIFPEGTRSRDGKLGPFSEGAFKIAKRCNAPIQVVSIRNTQRLFPPDRFLFNTCVKNTIEVRLVGRIEPDDPIGGSSASEMKEEAWSLLNNSLNS